jgi:hypothetical protein
MQTPIITDGKKNTDGSILKVHPKNPVRQYNNIATITTADILMYFINYPP